MIFTDQTACPQVHVSAHYDTLKQIEKLNAAQMGHVKDKPVIWGHQTY